MKGSATMQTHIENLVKRFQWIDRERMQGLPFYNDQLQVEALGFQDVDTGYVGVLITPWFINLMWLFKVPPQETAVLGHKCRHTLPGGEFEFMIGEDEEVGRYDFVSLASPVKQFKSQLQAREFALDKLREFFSPPEPRQAEEYPLVFIDKTDKKLSRRGFLRGQVQGDG